MLLHKILYFFALRKKKLFTVSAESVAKGNDLLQRGLFQQRARAHFCVYECDHFTFSETWRYVKRGFVHAACTLVVPLVVSILIKRHPWTSGRSLAIRVLFCQWQVRAWTNILVTNTIDSRRLQVLLKTQKFREIKWCYSHFQQMGMLHTL